MTTIPEIRKRLLELAEQLESSLFPSITKIGEEIRILAEATKRRPFVRRSGPRLEFTAEKRQEVLDYARNFPEMSYHELSRALNINTARISETLNPVA